VVDGKPQAVGNFRIEPPSLFRGRGEHPKAKKNKKKKKKNTFKHQNI
jgi:DNA topoisomerase-1